MKHKRLAPMALGLVTLLATVGILNAAPTQYDLSWWTADGGGGTVGDGTYRLSGTVGQPDAGPALENDGYALVGGYWYGAGMEQYELYLPSILRNH